VTFYRTLINLIERDQLKQIEDTIRSDPIVTNHSDPDHVLVSYISLPWYNQRPLSFLRPVYEWYVQTPFLQLTVMYKELCDPASLQIPSKEYLLSDLDKAHGSISETNYSNM